MVATTVSVVLCPLLDESDAPDSTDTTISLLNPSQPSNIKKFTFSQVITAPDDIYSRTGKRALMCTLEGANSYLIMYGPPGTGKTRATFGEGPHPGVLPLACRELFHWTNNNVGSSLACSVEVCFYEILSNETILSLLASPSTPAGKKLYRTVREDPELGPYVGGLTYSKVSSYPDMQRCVAEAQANRTEGSHAVFSVKLVQHRFDPNSGDVTEVTSQLNFVDMAACTASDHSTASFNQLVQHLSANPSATQLQYQESMLTWLLKEALGGNAYTQVVVTVNCAQENYEETVETLQFAEAMQNVQTTPSANEYSTGKLIRQLRGEVVNLRGQLAQLGLSTHGQLRAKPTKQTQYSVAIDKSSPLFTIVSPSPFTVDNDMLLFYVPQGHSYIGGFSTPTPNTTTLHQTEGDMESVASSKESDQSHLSAARHSRRRLRECDEGSLVATENEDIDSRSSHSYISTGTENSRKTGTTTINIAGATGVRRRHCVVHNTAVGIITVSPVMLDSGDLTSVEVDGVTITDTTVLKNGSSLKFGNVVLKFVSGPVGCDTATNLLCVEENTETAELAQQLQQQLHYLQQQNNNLMTQVSHFQTQSSVLQNTFEMEDRTDELLAQLDRANMKVIHLADELTEKQATIRMLTDEVTALRDALAIAEDDKDNNDYSTTSKSSVERDSRVDDIVLYQLKNSCSDILFDTYTEFIYELTRLCCDETATLQAVSDLEMQIFEKNQELTDLSTSFGRQSEQCKQLEDESRLYVNDNTKLQHEVDTIKAKLANSQHMTLVAKTFSETDRHLKEKYTEVLEEKDKLVEQLDQAYQDLLCEQQEHTTTKITLSKFQSEHTRLLGVHSEDLSLQDGQGNSPKLSDATTPLQTINPLSTIHVGGQQPHRLSRSVLQQHQQELQLDTSHEESLEVHMTEVEQLKKQVLEKEIEIKQLTERLAQQVMQFEVMRQQTELLRDAGIEARLNAYRAKTELGKTKEKLHLVKHEFSEASLRELRLKEACSKMREDLNGARYIASQPAVQPSTNTSHHDDPNNPMYTKISPRGSNRNSGGGNKTKYPVVVPQTTTPLASVLSNSLKKNTGASWMSAGRLPNSINGGNSGSGSGKRASSVRRGRSNTTNNRDITCSNNLLYDQSSTSTKSSKKRSHSVSHPPEQLDAQSDSTGNTNSYMELPPQPGMATSWPGRASAAQSPCLDLRVLRDSTGTPSNSGSEIGLIHQAQQQHSAASSPHVEDDGIMEIRDGGSPSTTTTLSITSEDTATSAMQPCSVKQLHIAEQHQQQVFSIAAENHDQVTLVEKGDFFYVVDTETSSASNASEKSSHQWTATFAQRSLGVDASLYNNELMKMAYSGGASEQGTAPSTNCIPIVQHPSAHQRDELPLNPKQRQHTTATTAARRGAAVTKGSSRNGSPCGTRCPSPRLPRGNSSGRFPSPQRTTQRASPKSGGHLQHTASSATASRYNMSGTTNTAQTTKARPKPGGTSTRSPSPNRFQASKCQLPPSPAHKRSNSATKWGKQPTPRGNSKGSASTDSNGVVVGEEATHQF